MTDILPLLPANRAELGRKLGLGVEAMNQLLAKLRREKVIMYQVTHKGGDLILPYSVADTEDWGIDNLPDRK